MFSVQLLEALEIPRGDPERATPDLHWVGRLGVGVNPAEPLTNGSKDTVSQLGWATSGGPPFLVLLVLGDNHS